MEAIVAGIGCKRCRQLKQMTEEALKELGADHVTLKTLDSLEAVCQCGIMVLPALVVDGRLLVSGQMPSKGRLLQLLQECLRLAADRRPPPTLPMNRVGEKIPPQPPMP